MKPPSQPHAEFPTQSLAKSPLASHFPTFKKNFFSFPNVAWNKLEKKNQGFEAGNYIREELFAFNVQTNFNVLNNHCIIKNFSNAFGFCGIWLLHNTCKVWGFFFQFYSFSFYMGFFLEGGINVLCMTEESCTVWRNNTNHSFATMMWPPGSWSFQTSVYSSVIMLPMEGFTRIKSEN